MVMKEIAQMRTSDRRRMGEVSTGAWSRRAFLTSGAITAAVGSLGWLRSRPVIAGGPATQRPISDFVNTQGTFCWPFDAGGCGFLFDPPIQNFLGWTDPKSDRGFSLDYAALVDRYLGSMNLPLLGTTYEGSIVEQPLADGRAEVHVSLHTKNAITWVTKGQDMSAPDPSVPSFNLLFGARITDVLLRGANPALGEGFLTLKFISTRPGAAIPDLVQLLSFPLPGQELTVMDFRGQADGELRHLFLGVPDGTPGRAGCTETGLLTKAIPHPRMDGFPAEWINLQPIGK
jgi:hypothetical protein